MRSVVYDQDLCIQAYRLQGTPQPFPCHFHDYYVFGLIEQGQRNLRCKGSEYKVTSGDILIFNPGDSHACSHESTEMLDYRALTVSQSVMRSGAKHYGNTEELPCFVGPVIRDARLAEYLHHLAESILEDSSTLEKEELYILFMGALWEQYVDVHLRSDRTLEVGTAACVADDAEHNFCAYGPKCQDTRMIAYLCDFMRIHYAEHITLDRLIDQARLNAIAGESISLSTSTLLRLFLRHKGITPYKYLESIRVQMASQLLQKGIMPADVAALVGFSDQSHLNRCFKRLTGLTPKAYQKAFDKPLY